MFKIDWYALIYDIFAYMVAFRSLLDEILYKLNFSRHLDIKRELPADIRGHVAIVTGGTRGLGLTVVRALISKGCTVCVASSQTRDKFVQLEKKIYDGLPEVDPETKVSRGSVMLQYLDLSSMDSVRSFVNEFKKTQMNVNYLICNAGIMFAPRQLTVDNFESHLAINYLGHCLMILELLPELKRAADKSRSSSRIVCVSSSTHRITKFKFHDILGEENYSNSQAYAQSKLAQIMFTAKLSRYLSDHLGWNNVQCFSLHPGVVLSELYEHVYLIKYFPFLIPLIKLLTRVSRATITTQCLIGSL
jgi:retinol dehydrogenase-12